jgi:uncharacterized protein (TIGR00369 family)
VDQCTFLDQHRDGLGRLLGMRFLKAEKDCVISEAPVDPRLMARAGAVHGGVIMAMADHTSAYAAILNMPPGCITATIESKTNFLRAGSGDVIRCESRPLHVGRRTSVWRATLSRGVPIAEVTQTQLYFEDKGAKAEAAAEPDAAAVQETGESTASERRRQIFEGARQVIAKKGFAQATIREIAAAAGMPVPTMYQYIERKEDVLALIYEYFMADYLEALRRAVSSTADPAEIVAAAVRETLANFDRNHRYIKLMFQETRALDPAARERVYALDARYIGVWRELLERLARKDGFDPDLAANLIYFLCTIWPLRHWTIGKHGRDKVENEITAFILRGLGLPARKAA